MRESINVAWGEDRLACRELGETDGKVLGELVEGAQPLHPDAVMLKISIDNDIAIAVTRDRHQTRGKYLRNTAALADDELKAYLAFQSC
jgi:hypothetical protein